MKKETKKIEKSRIDYKQGRTRNYATIVYEDSAPKNWLDIIGELKIPIFVSPYHDKDINPTGEPKKPHWHVIIMFDGVKTIEQAKSVIERFNGVGCEIVDSIRGYARYLCHLDNPEKHRYNEEDVKSFGVDYFETINLVTDKYKTIKDIIAFCSRNEVLSFADLLEYASIYESAWFRVLCDNGAYIVKEYISSYKKKDTHENKLLQ